MASLHAVPDSTRATGVPDDGSHDVTASLNTRCSSVQIFAEAEAGVNLLDAEARWPVWWVHFSATCAAMRCHVI